MAPAEDWFESHDGLRLFSRVYAAPAAQAPVVLCLHGLMRNSRDFEDLAARLTLRYRVIAPDVRGRGLSDRDPDVNNYQLPVYIRDVLALLAGLGASHVAVIGTSMGGALAMELAALQPKAIDALVLWSPLVRERNDRLEAMTWPWGQTWLRYAQNHGGEILHQHSDSAY